MLPPVPNPRTKKKIPENPFSAVDSLILISIMFWISRCVLHFFPLISFRVPCSRRQVSWIRHRDIHILTVGSYTYTSDQRFQATHHKNTDDWTLQIKWAQKRDAGIYECQISTQPVRSYFVTLSVVGKYTSAAMRPYILYMQSIWCLIYMLMVESSFTSREDMCQYCRLNWNLGSMNRLAYLQLVNIWVNSHPFMM